MTDLHTPMLSVVIPTHKRPGHLPRAIRSALASAPSGDVEVIVVQNGFDTSWESTANHFTSDSRVRWAPIANAQANAARNHGMRKARGQYLRFLDDDDALVAEGAKHQLSTLAATGADICSGTVNIVDGAGTFIRHMQHSDATDLFTAMARHTRLCLPTAHLFNRASLYDFEWDESVRVEQDTEWMLRISSLRDWTWVAVDNVVGEWTRHDAPRTSGTVSHIERWSRTSLMLIASAERLRSREALTNSRRAALSESLWLYAHSSFYAAPFFWGTAIKLARELCPDSLPPEEFFSRPMIRRINPLLLEWLMLPKRWINHKIRLAQGRA